MKKDIEWLKEEIEEDIKSWGGGNPDYFRGASDAYENVKDWLNRLDEPETLSQNFIDEHTQRVTGFGADKNGIDQYHDAHFVSVCDLQNLLVPKQELPVIPKFVAKWISVHHERFDLYPALKRLENNALSWEDVYEWYRRNTHTFVNAYLTGKYEVEERELTVKEVIEEHIELLKKQEVAVNLKPYYDLWEELKDCDKKREEKILRFINDKNAKPVEELEE